ncbi:MAG TPA: AAA family ATPase [Solirubrobacteraceae bacterium]
MKVVKNKAGSGKGVVLSTAADAWRREGYEVIGTAIAGATAERLGADAKLERAVNTSALLAQLDSGRTTLGPNTVVVMDEAGMADTNRLAELMHATAERESKLVLVGVTPAQSPGWRPTTAGREAMTVRSLMCGGRRARRVSSSGESCRRVALR